MSHHTRQYVLYGAGASERLSPDWCSRHPLLRLYYIGGDALCGKGTSSIYSCWQAHEQANLACRGWRTPHQ